MRLYPLIDKLPRPISRRLFHFWYNTLNDPWIEFNRWDYSDEVYWDVKPSGFGLNIKIASFEISVTRSRHREDCSCDAYACEERRKYRE